MNSQSPRICILGVGAGGCRAVGQMALQWREGPETAVASTKIEVLNDNPAARKIQLGSAAAGGLGAGGDPAVGRAAAEESSRLLADLFQDVHLAIIVVALGGGTGTGAAPIAARIARECGALVLCFATLPFAFEGESRRKLAIQGLNELRQDADAVITVPNQRLFELVAPGESAEGAFRKADEVLGCGIRAIWNLLVRRGVMKLDFADLRAVVRQSGGTSAFGYGEAVGDDRARRAASTAVESPLLDRGRAIATAQSLLVGIIGGPDLSLSEIEDAMSTVTAAARPDAHILMGACNDPEWVGRVSVTIVASEAWMPTPGPDSHPPAPPEKPVEPDPSRKGRGKATQTKLAFEATGKGRFKDTEPTIMNGEDLDIPTFRRRGLSVERD